MSKEERTKYEYDLSDKFIENYGEEANELRLCTNVHMNYSDSDFWVRQQWRKETSLRYLEPKQFDDLVVDAPPGSKPWVVMFGRTPFSSPNQQQPTDSMLHTMACMAALFPEYANYAFMDYMKAEKTHIAYDNVGGYGQMAPYVILFHEGKAYHMD